MLSINKISTTPETNRNDYVYHYYVYDANKLNKYIRHLLGQPIFGKKSEMLNFEDDCVPNGTTGKDANWGILIANTNMTIFIKTSI